MFKVIWRAPASTALLGHLLRAADKPGTWAIVRGLEAGLRLDPMALGESREVGERVVFARPFCVFVRVDEANRTVVVEELEWVGT